MICRTCGAVIPDDVKFCRYCGAKAETDKKYCPSCGKESSPDAKFCRHCGTELTAAAPVSAAENGKKTAAQDRPAVKRKDSVSHARAVTQKNEGSVTKKEKSTGPKKKGGKLLLILIAACVIFFGVRFVKKKIVKPETGQITPYEEDHGAQENDPYYITMNKEPDLTGLSDIRFDANDVISTETAEIAEGSTDCETDRGVKVSFSPFTAADEAHSLTVSAMREKSDGEYKSVAYDLLLDGEKARLPGAARISVPYDPSWGDNVFVQYFNEDTGKWEILYTETDGNGNAVFYTDHFCTFGVFCSMVTSSATDRTSEPGKIFLLDTDDPLNAKVTVDYAALASYLRKSTDSTIRETSGQTASYFVEKGLEAMGFYASSADLAAKGTGTAALLTGGFDKVAGFAGSASDALGHFGAVLTVGKMMTDVYRRGDNIDFYETLKDNKNDLTSLALYAGGTLGAGSVAGFCNAAGIMLFVYTTADAAITSIDLKGSGSVEEFAYREFSSKYIVYNTKTGVCYPRYVADAAEDAQTYYRDSVNDISLPCSAASGYADWYAFFDGIKKLKPDVLPEKIDNVLTQYTSLFWNLPETDPNTLDRFLKNTRTGIFGTGTLADDYTRPSDFKIGDYKAAFKADLYRWLRPYMQECLRSSYFAMLNDAFREAAELERQFNSEISFVLRDTGTESFEKSPYAAYKNTLSGTQSGDVGYKGTVNDKADVWTFTKENGYRISCTYLSYLLYGTPEYMRVRDGDRDVQAFGISPVYPETVIEFGEPVQISADYVWTLTDVWYGDRSKENQYPLRLYALYNDGDKILNPFEYGYEISFDETDYGFTADLNSNSFSSSTVKVTAPGKLVQRAEDFVFAAETVSFNAGSDPQLAVEASAPYFEVGVKNSKYGTMYYLTDGDSAQIPSGPLSAAYLSDQAGEGGMTVYGGLLIPEPEEDNVGQKVMFDTYGVCYIYQLLPANEAEKTKTALHHGDIWAFSQAEEMLD